MAVGVLQKRLVAFRMDFAVKIAVKTALKLVVHFGCIRAGFLEGTSPGKTTHQNAFNNQPKIHPEFHPKSTAKFALESSKINANSLFKKFAVIRGVIANGVAVIFTLLDRFLRRRALPTLGSWRGFKCEQTRAYPL